MIHPLIAHFQLLARYNTLANQRLYSACAELTDAERKQTRPAFFQSIHNTLNHIMADKFTIC
ncbi:DinB family protein (fragment) [Planktothrix sp. PCC 11201]|uniref:DinB family protein n=1 Tax=Planktothrix sp. PCC 11201 TaxID=1729650 RepID=UPI00091CC8C4